VRFTNSGTEANMMALAAARCFTGRSKIMPMEGGYHGGTLYFSHGASPVNAPFDCVMGHFNDVEATRKLIAANADELAAVILEPMLGGGGGISASPAFIAMLREETAKRGIVLIFDEVMTSRLHPGGLSAKLGIEPDLKTLGKYVGGGMSFGAFGGKHAIMALFDPTNPDALPHAGTFNNNTLTMNVGHVAMTEIYTPEACAALNARGDRLRDTLNDLFMRYQVKMKAMGQGSMVVIHPTAGEINSPHDIENTDKRLRQLLFLDLLEQGIYIAERGFMALSLVVTDADCDRLVKAVEVYITRRRELLV
jgi:glutamate-1-semialdehyde 2,1-aminomutase